MRAAAAGQEKKRTGRWQHYQRLYCQPFERAEWRGFSQQTIGAETYAQQQTDPRQMPGAGGQPADAALGGRTHDLGEASHFADDVVLLREGRVVQHGPLDALERSPTDPFVTRFLSAQKSLWGRS